MPRDARHEPLINRTVMLELDHEGVVHLHKEALAGLIESDALSIPGPRRRARPAGWGRVAISLGPGQVATFTGAACANDHRQAGVRFLPILLSWRPIRSSRQRRELVGE